jgi:hypothetical protein
MKYVFIYNNGNTGSEIEFDTVEQAIDEAEIKWGYLTRKERRKYTDRTQGGLFMVTDEEGILVRDWSEEVE